MDKNVKYMEARMALDSAMSEFIKAARAVGFEEWSITDFIISSAYDADCKDLYNKHVD